MTANRWRWTAGAIALMASACGQSDRSAGTPAGQEQVNAVATLETDEQPAPETLLPANAATAAPSPEPIEPSAEQIRTHYSPTLQTCLGTGDAAKGVSVAMGGCFNAELATQDAQLNAAYKQAMAARSDEDRTALRDRQRAWIKERDAHCREAATGGTIDLVEIPGCLLEETVRRRLALQTMTN